MKEKLKRIFVKLLKKYDRSQELCEDCSKGIWYIFYGSLVDRGQNTFRVWRKIAELYASKPKLFDPQFAKDFDKQQLEGILRKLGLRFPAQFARFWISASKQIVGKEKELCKNPNLIYKISGFGQKTGGLFIKLACRCGFVCPEKVLIPIDTNDKRFLCAYGIVQKFDQQTIKRIQEIIWEISQELNVDVFVLDDIMFWEGRKLKTKLPEQD